MIGRLFNWLVGLCVVVCLDKETGRYVHSSVCDVIVIDTQLYIGGK